MREQTETAAGRGSQATTGPDSPWLGARRTRPVRQMAAALLLFSLISLPGCGTVGRSTEEAEPPAAEQPETQQPETQQPGAVPPNEDAADRDEPTGAPMPFGQRKAELPESFPLEVPVIAGVVSNAAARDVANGVWLYRIEAEGTVDGVAEWYRRAYVNAAWTIVRDEASESGRVLVLGKGLGAETVLDIAMGEGGAVTVAATVGLGAGVTGSY